MHAQTLWACDFFSKHVWTKAGLVEVFVLFLLHVGTRRVHLAGMSARPNAAWMAERAREMTPILSDANGGRAIVLHDWGGKFTAEFDGILQAAGVEPKKVGPCKPNQNAFAERWVQSIQTECLDRFVVFGEDHLRHIVSQYFEHYNEQRPHQAHDNLPLSWTSSTDPNNEALPNDVVCDQRLGGLLKHYRRSA